MKDSSMILSPKALRLLFFNVIALTFNVVFGGSTYSNDSYVIAHTNYLAHLEAFVGSYRFFGAALFKVFRLFGYDPIHNATPSIFAYIVIVATVTTWLSLRLETTFQGKGLLAINLSLLIASTNCWFCEILSFPECILITAIGMALTFAAIGFITNEEKQSVSHCVVSVCCLILATGIYQQFLALFAVYSIALCCARMWRHDDRTVKGNLQVLVKPMVLCAVSAIVYFIIAKIVCGFVGIRPNSRISNSVKDILINAIHILRKTHSYIKGRGLFSTEVLFVCFALTVLLFTAAIFRELLKKKNLACVITIVTSTLCAYLVSMAAAFLSCSGNTRAMFPLFAMYGFITLVIPQTVKRKYITAMTAVLAVVVLLNIGKTVECEMNLKKINMADELWAKQVIAEIEAYEGQSGIEIKTIMVGADDECGLADITPAYKQSAMTVGYARESLLLLWADDRDYSVEKMPEEVYQELFEGKNWDVYLPSKQIVFQGDTAYVCGY